MSAGDLPSRMQGAVLTGPEQIEIRELPVPRPGPGEIVLEVRAATTCGTDVKVFRRGGHPRMLQVPTLFGHEMAGMVAAIGAEVRNVAMGDAVVVVNSAPCQQCRFCRTERENLCEDLHYLNGGFADYLLVPKRFVDVSTHKLPKQLSFERAALTEPLACVLHGIDACELQRRGQAGPVQAVVYGAGPIGLGFTAVLASMGHHVILADPNPGRLATGVELGAKQTLTIDRGGGQAERVRAVTTQGAGVEVAIDCTGVPEVWRDAIDSVRPGGLVNLFGGCAPGTQVPLDTHALHYGELTLKGVYHHRPTTVRNAMALLCDPEFAIEKLISGRRPVAEVEPALRAMMAKEVLKVVIGPEPEAALGTNPGP